MRRLLWYCVLVVAAVLSPPAMAGSPAADGAATTLADLAAALRSVDTGLGAVQGSLEAGDVPAALGELTRIRAMLRTLHLRAGTPPSTVLPDPVAAGTAGAAAVASAPSLTPPEPAPSVTAPSDSAATPDMVPDMVPDPMPAVDSRPRATPRDGGWEAPAASPSIAAASDAPATQVPVPAAPPAPAPPPPTVAGPGAPRDGTPTASTLAPPPMRTGSLRQVRSEPVPDPTGDAGPGPFAWFTTVTGGGLVIAGAALALHRRERLDLRAALR